MKKILFLFFACGLVCSHPAIAQSPTDSISFVYSLWNAEQRKAMLLHMDLSESEKTAFTPVYDTYSRVIAVLEIEHLQLLHQYFKGSAYPVEDEILLLYGRLLQNDFELAKLRIQYHKKFRKVLSCSRANEFMSLDQSLRTLFHLELQKNAPAMLLSQAAIYSMNNRKARARD